MATPLRGPGSQQGPLTTGGGPTDTVTEHRLTALETRLDTTLPHLATKDDVTKAQLAITIWIVGTGLVIVGILIAYLNFAKQPAQPQPIIIQAAPTTPAQPSPQQPSVAAPTTPATK